jgi:uncharacterized protein (TIGR02246 family)
MDKRVTRWLDAYFTAWQSNDPDQVAVLFARDAAYWVGPYAEPWQGRDEIVQRWTAGCGTKVRHSYTVLATAGRLAVAHWRVAMRLDDGRAVELDGILMLTFNDAQECVEHREWYVERPAP